MSLARRLERQAEECLLAAAVADSRCAVALEAVTEADFGHAPHALIYRAIRLYLSRFADRVQPFEGLDPAKVGLILAELGGPDHLPDAIRFGLSQHPENAEWYAATVRHGGALRRSRELAAKSVADYDGGAADAAEVDSLSSGLSALVGGPQASSEWTTGLDLAKLVVSASDEARERGGRISGSETGFATIDRITDGYIGGQFWILAGRPSTGKSALALNSAIHVARVEKKPIAFISLEMTNKEMGERSIAHLARLDSYTIRRGSFRAEDYPRFARGAGVLSELDLNVVEGTTMGVDEIRARVRRLNWQRPLGLVVVDYLQLVRPRTGGNRNRENEVSEISRGLKALALELKVPVVALSQFNREADKRKPRLSDLRESGALEQDADVAILLHREKDEDTKITAIVAKNRNGARGVEVELEFDGPTTTFEEMRR